MFVLCVLIDYSLLHNPSIHPFWCCFLCQPHKQPLTSPLSITPWHVDLFLSRWGTCFLQYLHLIAHAQWSVLLTNSLVTTWWLLCETFIFTNTACWYHRTDCINNFSSGLFFFKDKNLNSVISLILLLLLQCARKSILLSVAYVTNA